MARLTKLKELMDDNPTWVPWPEWKVADTVNSLTVDRPGNAQVKKIRRYLVLRGLWGGIVIAGRGSDALASVCQTVMAALEPGAFDDLDYSEPGVTEAITSMCDVLVTASLISTVDKREILNMGTYVATRWVTLNGYPMGVSPQDVGNVRNGILD